MSVVISTMSSLDHLGFVEPQRPCSYLAEETASLEYRLYRDVTADSYMRLLERGWRRHGRMFFRPQCPSCRQCIGLRVPVDDFQPTKSQRRARNKNADVQVRLSPATVTPEH